MKIAITGANGFIGKNLLVHLRFAGQADIVSITRDDTWPAVADKLENVDVVFHVAGVNRPTDPSEFERINVGMTTDLVMLLESKGRPYTLVYTSSAQAVLENPYGVSKLHSEEAIGSLVKNGKAIIYRLPGVFGKWCRPEYNSVVATFCHNVATGKPLHISDERATVNLVYIDDVVARFVSHLHEGPPFGSVTQAVVEPVHSVSLGTLAALLTSFKENRSTLFLPDVGDRFTKALYTTWLSYLPEQSFSYHPELKTDNRGWLFELLKTRSAGQIFISKTHPGITRGNHFHHTKTEKFVVIQGEGIIRFRNVLKSDIIEYRVSGHKPEVVDIPPGYTHSITNTGSTEMLTLFWANEVFDPGKPDTFFVEV